MYDENHAGGSELPADEMSGHALRVLGTALDHRDRNTADHCGRVCHLARLLGERCDLLPGQLRDLELAARFHDVGKIGIPDAVLLSPAMLEEDDWELMKTHPGRGEQLFLATGHEDAGRIAALIRHHHEAVDGSGYPDALHGSAIPLECRVLSLVDAYDAMTSARPYRAPMPQALAMRNLGESVQRQLDPDVFRVFEGLLRRGLDTGD